MKLKSKFFIAILLYSLLSPQSIFSSELKTEELNIYVNKSFLVSTLSERVDDNKKISVILPTKASNSVFFISPKECDITLVRDIPIEDDTRYIERKNKLSSLENQILAVEFSLKALEKVSSERFKDAVENIENLEKQKLNLEEKFYNLNEKYRKEKREFDKFLATFHPTEIFIHCNAPSDIKLKAISFLNFGGFNRYDVIADIENKGIILRNHLVVFPDRDLEKVYITYYPFFIPFQLKVPTFINKKRENVSGSRSWGLGLQAMRIEKATKKIFEHSGDTEVAEYKYGYAHHYYVLKTPISLKKDVFQTIHLSTDIIKNVEFKVVIDAYNTLTPYLIAEFVPLKDYAKSDEAIFFIDDMYVGSDRFYGAKKGEKSKISFGKDNKIVVKKEVLKDYREKTFFGKEIHTYIVRYTIKNKHNSSIKVSFVDSVPPVTSDNIKVELLEIEKFKPKRYDKVKGKIEWEFSIPANDEYILKYGYKAEISR